MKVLLINGSPHQKGSTFTALSQVGEVLNEEGIDTELYWIGPKAIQGCIGCFKCLEKKECIFKDMVNDFTKLATEYDGFIFASPVYYAGMNGSMKSFMDRVFWSASNQYPHPFRFKPAAAIAVARRAGATSALDEMNRYFLHQQMTVAPSRYWNQVYGRDPEEILQDEEGMQILRYLGRNMAWLLKLKEAGEKAGIPLPEQEDERIATNFVR